MDKKELIITIINDLRMHNFCMKLKLETGLYKSFEEMNQLKQDIKENKKIIDLYYKMLEDLEE